ncbi:MAG: 2-phospho-L-lactate guanylyltransferase [Anaerolineaceae bacterium]|jgi:2-phospho-L-lactate guanylyltransferase
MNLWAVLPVKPLKCGKSRLHGCLSEDEVYALNRSMFENTYEMLRASTAIEQVLVVSSDEEIHDYVYQTGGTPLREKPPYSLNSAVTQALAYINENDPGKVLIVPSDLPMMTAEDLAGFLSLSRKGRFLALVPDQCQWGTNAILISHPHLLTPRFGRRSFQKHAMQAAIHSAELIVWLNRNIQRDLDTPQDLFVYNKIKPHSIQFLKV